jgi:uncharacterized protein with HEPN domain
MISNIQIIGEAGRGIPNELRARYLKMPWRAMIDMRDILVHHHFDIDLDAV